MISAAADVEALWARLQLAGRGEKRFVTLRIDNGGTLDVQAALRAVDDAPCLLFELACHESARSLDFEAGGMRCSRSMLEEGPALVLSLEDELKRDLFATLCADILAYASSEGSGSSIEAVIARVEDWQAFLRSTNDRMTRSETIGLIGELHVLRAILAKKSSLLATWRAPDHGIHDFEHSGMALEVKTTVGAGSRITIASLDQLDDIGLERLGLILVRLVETSDGENIDDLATSISSLFKNSKDRRQFSSALLRRGLSPDDLRARSGIRASISKLQVHPVQEGFPRVLRRSISPAIIDASYVLELAHLASQTEPFAVVVDGFITRRQ
ncbi:PD-(D/E)XK motif protein (plasmid) [Rhizobium sp. B230/85]|uniref:PD-(D/E)XK motif protein n=1 Tax=unclassified Rhizobium TaxID=2613769 RepID=UPI001ADD5F43|nr:MULTISPECIES: PD-(D/E)XK motif protein [unclassified Rhizobium]MBO9136206.1 PD-(D/E)XK motif protein [Rhizobium sp. B209b/85]QXZ99896.1 PD-(D/E)XK motif protein [Rhizobium sp. B230/85]